MRQSLPRYREIMFCGKFKLAMWELCREKGMTFAQAEKELGFRDGFIESVDKNIHKLTLEEVQKIACYFHTTMDAVLDGGKIECRIFLNSLDELSARQKKECFEAYLQLLNDLAMRHWKPEHFNETAGEKKLQLEKCQWVYVEHYKAVMDELEEKDRTREIAKCEDDVLVKELLSRGYKVEKDGE